MKTANVILFLVCIVVLQCSRCYSQGKEGLVAAPYPGSITEPPVEPNSRTFYTKEPIEKVMAHYTKSLGAFKQTSPDRAVYIREAIPSIEVMDFLAKKGINTGERNMFARVTLSGKGINPDGTVLKVLDNLTSAYLMRFNDPDVEDPPTISKHVEDAELKQTVARYEHVEWEHFARAKEKRMNQVIFEKYFVTPEEAAQKEEGELATKMQALMTQMKFDEATKLGNRMMELYSRHTDARRKWDNAIKCLQEMEKNAYATMIVIDKHPSQWDLSGFK